MFSQFRSYYPQGSLMSELVAIESGRFVVRAIASVNGTVLASSLAAADTVEQAEDRARCRLFELIELKEMLHVPTVAGATTSPIASFSDVPALTTQATGEPLVREMPFSTSSEPPVSPVRSPRDRTPSFGEVPHEISPPPEPAKTPASPAEVVEAVPVARDEEPAIELKSVVEESFAPSFEGENVVPSLGEKQEEEEAIALPFGEPQEEQPEKTENFDKSASPLDFSEIIAQTNLEIKRLGWTNEQGRKHLLETYGKRSRQLLSDEELIEFLDYLKSQPIPQ